MVIGWAAMLVFTFHACTHMVAAGDTWVAMACGRHFVNHGVDTVEPFSANSHKPGPTPEEIKAWPSWAQWIAGKVGLETVNRWHPTGWINQNWLTHVIFYLLVPKSSYADGVSFSSNALVYWKFAIYILTVICVYYIGRLLGVNPALCVVFVCFAMFTGRSFFDIRPAGFSNLLVAVFLLILVLATYRNILYIWLIVPVTVFWCNVHGGYIYVFIMLVPFVGLHLLTALSKKTFHSIGLKGVCHTVGAGAAALLAVILFNPFHLTNLTHTFVISVSKHAERWRDVHEWKGAFDWDNPVGTSFPFLVLLVLSVGLLVLWVSSRFLIPRLLKAPLDELQTQQKRFKRLSVLLGYAAAVLVCWVTFVSLSLLSLDALSFLFCAVFTAILTLSVWKNVHIIYLVVPLTLVAVWSGDATAGYDGRYFYPFVIVPVYVILHTVASLISKTVKYKPVNIVFVALAAITSLLLMAVIFNPFEFKTPVWNVRQFLHLQRIWRPPYERNVELSYAHLFDLLYIVSIAVIIIWLAMPYLRRFAGHMLKGRDGQPAGETYQLPKMDLGLMAVATLTIYMAVRSRRFIPIAAIAACPIAALLIEQIISAVSASRNFYTRNRLAISRMPRGLQLFFTGAGATAVLFFGTVWGLKFKHVYLDPWPSDPKFSSIFMRMTASDAKPFYAMKFIKDNKLEGNMFNYWTEGGFIAWGQQPDPNTGRTPLQLFMDGRAQAAYDRKTFDIWTYIMAGGLPGSTGFNVFQTALARAKLTGQTLEEILTPDDYTKIGQSMSQEFQDRGVWVVLLPAAAYRDPDQSSSYYTFKALENDPNWRPVFFDDRQKLYVDIRTPRGKALFGGIFDGTTIYPDDYHGNLVRAQSQLLYGDIAARRTGLDAAMKAFELNPSPTPMLEALAFGNFRELSSAVDKLCQEYFDQFKENQDRWAKQDGYRLRVEAVRLASIHLKQVAQRRRNIKLVNLYASIESQYLDQLGRISEGGRW